MWNLLVKNVYREIEFSEEIQNTINTNTINELFLIFSQFGNILDTDHGIDSYNSSIFVYKTENECDDAINKLNIVNFKGLKLEISKSIQ